MYIYSYNLITTNNKGYKRENQLIENRIKMISKCANPKNDSSFRNISKWNETKLTNFDKILAKILGCMHTHIHIPNRMR